MELKIPIKKSFVALFLLAFSSSTRINIAISTGLITKATNKEEPNTIINVIGKYCINSPIIPGHKAKGTKAKEI